MKKKIRFSRLPKAIKAEFLLPIIAVLALLSPYVDQDAWFILNCGRYIENNGLPHTEVFSMHEGFSGIFQQWLSDVAFWQVYKHFKGVGIVVLLVIAYFIIAFLAYKLCMLVSNKNHFVSCAVLLLICSATLKFFIVARPQVFTIIILMAALLCLEEYSRSGNWKYLIAIPFLSVLEINMHASMWLVLFILMLPYIVDSFKFDLKIVKCAGIKKLPLFITFFISLLCGFINPYGIDAMTYLFRSYNLKYLNSYIAEMYPVSITSSQGVVYLILILTAVIAVTVCLAKQKASVPVRYILLVGGFGFMNLTAYRNGMFFVPLAMFVTAYCLRRCDPYIIVDYKENKKSPAPSYKQQDAALKALAVMMTVLFSFAAVFTVSLKVSEADGVSDEKGAVDYILANYDIEGTKTYTDYNDGTYCEYMGLRPYIDARAELYYKSNNGKADVFIEYIELKVGKISVMDFINQYDFDFIILNADDIIGTYMKYLPEYKKVYNDEYRTLYVRNTAPQKA